MVPHECFSFKLQQNVCSSTLLYSFSRLLLMTHATAHHSETTHSHSFGEIHRFYWKSVSFPVLPRVLRGDPITGFWPHLSDHLPPDVAASWRPVWGLSARLLRLLHRFVVGSAMRFSVLEYRTNYDWIWHTASWTLELKRLWLTSVKSVKLHMTV